MKIKICTHGNQLWNEILLQADKDGESNIPQELGNEIEELLR
jgi:hypothetical protein